MVNEIVDKIRALSDLPFVTSVDEHFAGYFNELGLSLFLSENCTPLEFEQLVNTILAFLNEALPKGNDKFSWMLFFYKDNKQVGLFFPGDEFSDNSENGFS